MTVTAQDNAEFESDASSDEALGDVSDVAPEADAVVDPSEDTDDAGAEGSEEHARLSVDEYGDHMVTVKIDGEDVEMTLKEALSAGMRQADYTRKTQALAAERERLAQVAKLAEWLEKDPVGTIRELQKAVGVDAANALIEEAEELDPEEARLRRLEAIADQQESRARSEAIVQEATAAVTAAGLPADAAADLLQFALENQIMDLSKAARFFKAEHAETLKAQAEEAKAKEQADLLKRKRAAAVVESGPSRAPATAIPGKGKKLSLTEAYEAAKLSLRTG